MIPEFIYLHHFFQYIFQNKVFTNPFCQPRCYRKIEIFTFAIETFAIEAEGSIIQWSIIFLKVKVMLSH